jgi:uncharacterized protein YjiS (DUF1127 family)
MSFERQQRLFQAAIGNAQVARARLVGVMFRKLLRRMRKATMLGRRSTRNPMIGLVAALSRWWQAYATWERRRRAMARLHALSDRELKDIGVRRSEIYWVAHHGRYEPPTRARGRKLPAIPADPVGPQVAPAATDDVTQKRRAA